MAKDADFESNPDLTLQLEEPTVCGQWVAYKDQYETNVVTIGVSDDTTQGKVAKLLLEKLLLGIRQFYLSVLDGTVPLGIYRFSFLGLPDDGGQLRVYTRATDENNSNVNKFFIKV